MDITSSNLIVYVDNLSIFYISEYPILKNPLCNLVYPIKYLLNVSFYQPKTKKYTTKNLTFNISIISISLNI